MEVKWRQVSPSTVLFFAISVIRNNTDQ